MNSNVPFINRQDERNTIKNVVLEHQTTKYLFINANQSGIGKSRLLQETQNVCKELPNAGEVFVAPIIDFDSPVFRFLDLFDFLRLFALEKEAFQEFLTALDKWKQLEYVTLPQNFRGELIADVKHKFCQCFNEFSSVRRVVIRFDTVEKYYKEDFWSALAQLSLDLKNVVFIVSGRNAITVYDVFSRFTNTNLQLLELEPLDTNASMEYLTAFINARNELPERDIDERIVGLAGGLFIRIDLALEWRSRGIPLDWIMNIEVPEDGSTPQAQEVYEEFERSLVSHLYPPRNKLNQLLLFLSRIYPLDQRNIQTLIRCSSEEAQDLFDRAAQLVFVRVISTKWDLLDPSGDYFETISLHDEMRNLINRYIWPERDPEEGRRKRDSRLASEMFARDCRLLQEEIESLEETEQSYTANYAKVGLSERLAVSTLQLVEHSMFYDVEQGFDEFQSQFRRARRGGQTRIARQLIDLISGYLPKLDHLQQVQFIHRQAQILNDTGDAEEAKNLLQQVVNEIDEDDLLLARVLNELGRAEVLLGNYHRALEYKRLALDKFDALGKIQSVSSITSDIGFISQALGEWEEALVQYETALRIASRTNMDADVIATILNNMAHVFSSQGKSEVAEQHASRAIAIWRRAHQEKHVTLGEMTLAVVYRDQGDPAKYDQAISLLLEVLNKLDERLDARGACKAHFHLGWTYWFKAQSLQDNDLLSKAQPHLETSRRIAEENHFFSELPGILHQSSNVYSLLGDFETARSLNTRAYDLSLEYHDIRYQIDSLVGFAELDLKEDIYKNIPDIAQRVLAYEAEGYKYPLFFGRMRKILAIFEFEVGNRDEALSLYAKGLPQIAEHGGWGPFSIEDELKDLEERLSMLSPELACQWCGLLEDTWANEPTSHGSSLISWAVEQRLRFC